MKEQLAIEAETQGLAGRYLTVLLEQEAYGIPVLKVREIINFQEITRMPQVPPYVKGVINLRGHVIPIIDLRMKLGLKDSVGDRTCIVVVQVEFSNSHTTQMGLVVDMVEEVVYLENNDIRPVPNFDSDANAGRLLGIAEVEGKLKTLLDIERIISPELQNQLSGDR